MQSMFLSSGLFYDLVDNRKHRVHPPPMCPIILKYMVKGSATKETGRVKLEDKVKRNR
jgi:hypothetical protein